MRRIKVWEAEDGSLYRVYEDAFDKDTLLDSEDPIGEFVKSKGGIFSHEIADFIKAHKEDILGILSYDRDG